MNDDVDDDENDDENDDEDDDEDLTDEDLTDETKMMGMRRGILDEHLKWKDAKGLKEYRLALPSDHHRRHRRVLHHHLECTRDFLHPQPCYYHPLLHPLRSLL